MRTTLSLDDDVVKAVKKLARAQGLTMGEVANSLLRHALTTSKRPKPRHVHPMFRKAAARA